MTIEIQEGFKRTTVGIIPIDWDMCKLKSASKVLTGSTPSTAESSNYGNEYLFVSPGDLGNGKYILKSAKMLSKKGFSVSRKFPKGSILFTCIGSTIGKMGIAPVELTSNQQINAIVTNDSFSNEFLFYQLQRLSKKIKLIAGEQAVPIINKSQFECIYFGFPPLIEQQKIAEILSTWDTAIETCQKTIEQLKQRNKGLAQQLLSGKKRLEGFSDKEWNFVKFKEFYAPNKNPSGNATFELLSVTKNGIVSQEKYFNKSIASEDTSKYLIVQKGDFVVSGLNFWMGSYDVLTDFEIGMVSPAYKVFRLNEKYSKPFFKHLVASRQMKNAMISSSVVGASIVRRNFDLEVLYEYAFKIPEINEQEAIGNVLDAAQEELTIYEGKLHNLQLQKKGLMQQLLTGKVRTVNL